MKQAIGGIRRIFCAFIICLFCLPATAQSDDCALPPRLTIGAQGVVTPGQSNNVRDQPSRGGQKVGEIPSGGSFDVLDGPVCADGFNWWQVDFDGLVGWTVEGQDAEYWIEPFTPAEPTTPPTNAPPTPLPRVYSDPDPNDQPLTIGGQARVNTGSDHLRARESPDTQAAIVTELSAGTIVTLMDGPQKVDDLIWWQVQTEDGETGWAIEGVVIDGLMPLQTLLPLCPHTTNRIAFAGVEYLWDSPEEEEAGHMPYQRHNLYTVDADGKNPCNLTGFASAGAWMTEIAWSPDGSQVAFVYGTRIYIIRPDGTDLRPLTRSGTAASITWSPDSRKLAYVMSSGSSGADVWVINADGSRPYPVTTSQTLKHYARWSPDGSLLAYIETTWGVRSSFRDDQSILKVIAPEFGTALTLTDETIPALIFTAEWHPAGTQLIFSAGGNLYNAEGIWSIDVENKLEKLIAMGEAQRHGVEAPSWSPDGKLIAYWDRVGFSSEGGTLIIDDGSEKKALISNVYQPNRYWASVGFRPEGMIAPMSWSPDSRALTFFSLDGISVADMDSGEVNVIYDGSTTYVPPQWQPGGIDKCLHFTSQY